MSDSYIPFFRPDIDEIGVAAVGETLRSGWLTSGPRTREFEQRFADYVGAEHAVAVNSCTAGLHLALAALGVTTGDEVIVPTMTFAATAEVVIHLGARPVLVDCEPDTLNIDPDAIAAAITPRTKAIIPVHFGGQPASMDRIMGIAATHEIPVVEDAAHA
ncbi:MAG: DegT/DnrJ/EryC1/StrS aminotransferase family protein, partial [Actinomycetia bacterium]|nr:DegT/DnrJ/EryC1/StrS aminotransferase family protein [Actinomycetes bacterium]